VQPHDLLPTLVEWLALPALGTDPPGGSLLSLVRDEPATYRDRAILVGEGKYRAIRTPAWYLLRPGTATGDAAATHDPAVELYAKPDDRWDVNNVADRCAEVVDLLEQVLAESAQSSSETSSTPLADVLLAGLD
jgi:hypothetical protein